MLLEALDRYVFGYTHAGSQLKDFIYARSRRLFAAGDAARDALRTSEDVRARQAKAREVFLAGIGGLPPSDTPLNPRVTGRVIGDGFTVEKVIFESRPRHYVTANLYLPTSTTGPAAAVLFLCGHHAEAKLHPEYQAVCQTLVRSGLIVLAQDPIGQGERLSFYDPASGRAGVPPCTLDHDTLGAPCRLVGTGLARYFLHDAMRSIDYLLTRPEVDPARIGVTGNSGGGTQTSMVMLADPRIAAAAPGTFIMSREEYLPAGQPQDAEQIWPGFTAAGCDHEDILIAMAPKPVCVLAVTSDFFPIEGTRRTVARARRAWELCGRGAALELVEDTALHAYTPTLARAAAQFFTRALVGRRAAVENFEPAPFPLSELRCTASGQVRAEFRDAETVQHATAARAAMLAHGRGQTPADLRRARAQDWLRAQVFRGRENCLANPRRIEREWCVDGFVTDVAFWWSQPRLANFAVLVRRVAGIKQGVTIALWPDGTRALAPHAAWLARECDDGRAVLVVDLCGMGRLTPDPINPSPLHAFYGTLHKLVDDLEWMGDSLAALRTFELLRVPEILGEWPEIDAADVRVYAEGRAGLPAKLAAALEPRLARCEWAQPFGFAELTQPKLYDTDDVKSLLLPGVLQFFDLDEI